MGLSTFTSTLRSPISKVDDQDGQEWLLARSLEVFCGRLSPLEAQLYVRVPELPGGERWSLSGTLRGPVSRVAKTLPATARLDDCGVGPSLLGRVVVSEPCYWTPDLPALYDLHVEVLESGSSLFTAEWEIGFRFFGQQGTHLRWENRRCVLRGGAVSLVSGELAEWCAQRLVVLADTPSSELCVEAAREGLPVVAYLEGDPGDLVRLLRRLARSPAVVAAVVPDNVHQERTLRNAAGNMLLGQRLSLAGTLSPAPWADLVFCESDFLEGRELGELPTMPIVAMRAVRGRLSPGEVRLQCDQLQRDLARLGDFAGYFIINQ